MSPESWLAFALASAVLLALPGPTVLLIVSYALGHGRRAALPTVAGVALGDLTAMTASLLGLGVLLAASAELFTVLRLIGAAYLVLLGVRLWRAPVGSHGPGDAPAIAPRRMLAHAYAVTALNPKSIVFFVAFLPQFIDAHAPLVPQLVICEVTFIVLATLNALGYALAASAARRAIRRPSVQRAVNRTGGALLMGAGVFAAAWKKAT